MRHCHPLAVALVACLALARVASASVPDPAKSTTSSPFIDVEGSTGGAPDDCSDGRCSDFTVTVRDFANAPIAGSTVVIDFSGCPDIQLSCDQINFLTGQSYLGGKKVAGTTNAGGQFTFKAQGSGTATVAGAPGTRVNVPCAQLYADGVSLRSLIVAAYDVDGLGSPATAVDSGDLAIVSRESSRVMLGFNGFARDDYNHSGTINGADVARSAAMVLDQQAGTGSSKTAPFCP